MAFNENIANKIREALQEMPNIYEKNMFGGLCFMVNEKMCMGVIKDEMMCRIDPKHEETVLELNGCRLMDFTGKPMRGYIFVSEEGMKTKKDFEYWLNLCLEFNSVAKATKKKVKKG